MAGVVHRLVGHARRHGAIADYRDDVVFGAVEIAGDRHPERRRDRCRCMRRAERVVFAFGPPRETGKAAGRSQGPDAVAPPGQDLVGIGLVADVPDQPVARRVEDVVQSHRQLDHAEARAEMPAGDRDRRDRLAPKFVRHLPQVGFRQAPEVVRRRDPVEDGSREIAGQSQRIRWKRGLSHPYTTQLRAQCDRQSVHTISPSRGSRSSP